MSMAPSHERLTVPESLQQQLHSFRRRVWSTKMLEIVAMAAAGLLLAFCAVFALDRWVDTPKPVRFSVFVGILALWSMVPWAFHRWVWSHRRLDQLAKLLRKREPNIGDQLLGVIELSESESEQARSRTLCAAAMKQVAEAAKSRDLTQASPISRHRTWGAVAGGVAVVCGLCALMVPQASQNAWERLLAPWRETPRYTFTTIEPLSDRIVVAHGEPFDLKVRLAKDSQWKPQVAKVTMPFHDPITASQLEGDFLLAMPALTQEVEMTLRIGDYFKTVTVEPSLRPELSALDATVLLPSYLQLPTPQQRDARSGTVTVVAGAKASLSATASRSLTEASLDGQPIAVKDKVFEVPALEVPLEGKQISVEWRDRNLLAGREPFKVALQGRPDEAPSVTCEGLPRQAVILNTEQINFSLFAGDDFGIKQAGIEWKGLDDRLVEKVAKGDQPLSAGGPDQAAMQLQATFCANDLGIEPQPIELRIWVEDYLPERGRVYSPAHLLYVLSPDQHAIWMTEQLSKWHRQSLDIRDREMQLHETNKQLRELSATELDDPENRRKMESQAAAEANNGRRLGQLSKMGEELIRQASRNSEIGVGHLERWAEMLQVLKDISSNRMPSVEDLLHQAAKSQVANKQPKATGPQAGKIRDMNSAPGNENPEDFKPEEQKPSIPSIVDRESSQQPLDNDPSDPSQKKKKPSQGRLTLPNTTIASVPPNKEKEEEKDSEAQPSLDEAVKEQKDLLAEFEKIADELNNVLANLEGSTLVKRLKAASREQLQVAGKISDRIDQMFGQSSQQLKEADKKILTALSEIEGKSVQAISYIMDDMQAYFERRRMNQFKIVLDEMRQVDILSALRQLGDEIPKEQGMSIAQCEFWSDSLDRWADDLVDPASKGSCPGGKSKDSLPPSIILEVLQILEGEVNLREQTRVAEQAKGAVSKEDHAETGDKLADKQDELQLRVEKVIERIMELPEAEANFAKEIELLNSVDIVMGEAAVILCEPNTGATAVAAETEAIELLLKSKRINPKGGGGGGTSPGGGGQGTTNDSALALVGSGINAKEHRERRDIQQATGENSAPLPEEFRAGLDEYFNRLDTQPLP